MYIKTTMRQKKLKRLNKKIVCILYSIVLIGINVFGFAIFSNYRMTDKIFHKRVVEVQSRQQELVNVSEVHNNYEI